MLAKLRIDFIIFGGLGVFLLLSILTSDFNDPTLFNQLYPSLGVNNWTGLIGALIGGSLLEIFGTPTLLIPWIIVRIALHHPRKFSIFTSYYYAFVIIFLLSIFHEIAIQSLFFSRSKADYLLQSGYAGKLGLAWLEESIDIKIGILAMSLMLFFSLVRMMHVLSPLPLIKGVYIGVKNLIKKIFVNEIHSQSSKNQKNRNLPNFKGSSQLFENESK